MAFLGAIRNSLFDEFPVHVLVNLWLVTPNLYPDEQHGASDRYLIADYDCPLDQVAIVVIIQDPEEPDFERHVIRVRQQMTNLLLYMHVRKTAKCTSDEFQCSVSHAEQGLPSGAYWPTFQGMKVNIGIQEVDRRLRPNERSSKRVCYSQQTSTGKSDTQLEDWDFHDESSMMHLFSAEEMTLVEPESILRQNSVQSYAGILSLHPDGDHQGDLLRSYIHDRKGQITYEAFTVHVWMLAWPRVQVTHTAQRCPMYRTKSYTKSLLQLWAVAFDVQPLAVTLVHPDLQPLTLRAIPTDLIVLPESDVEAGRKALLLDVVGMPLPRRLALFLKEGDTVRSLADLAGARQICDLPSTECVLQSAAPDNRQEWRYDQVVTVDHGSGLTLWIHPKQPRQFVTISSCSDTSSFMQNMPVVLTSPNDQMYLQAAVRVGYMHMWVHDVDSTLRAQTNHRRVRWDRTRTPAELQEAVWVSKHPNQDWRFQVVWPFPWMGQRPQPTLIFYCIKGMELWAILLQASVDDVPSLHTMVLTADYAPFSTDFLFDSALPDHRCREESSCTAKMDDARFNFLVDIPIYPGAFVELDERRLEREDTSTTIEEVCEDGEESSLTDDDVVQFTQMDIQSLRFVRCPETGRPLSTRLRAQGSIDYDQHWEFYEVLAMGALSRRGTQVYILWFGEEDAFSKLNVNWHDGWAAQTGMTTARAEIRLLLWDDILIRCTFLVQPRRSRRPDSNMRKTICFLLDSLRMIMKWPCCWL